MNNGRSFNKYGFLYRDVRDMTRRLGKSGISMGKKAAVAADLAACRDLGR